MTAKLFLIAITLLPGAPSIVGAEARPRGYYELRIYTVTSNKLEAVVERFRNTVDPVRRKHGIDCPGYWTAQDTTGEQFIYLMAAASKEELGRREKEFGADPEFKAGYAASSEKHGKTVDKITTIDLAVDPSAKMDFSASATPRAFDLRIYSVPPNKLDAFRNRWRDHATPIYERHGLHSLGWWVAEKKDSEGNNLFIGLLGGKSVSAIQKSISEFHGDAEWQRVEKETEREGKLRGKVEAFKLTPTDFSSIQ